MGPAPEFSVTNGYILSKYVAERLITEAQHRGATSMILRPGNISGDSRQGMTIPELNHTLLLIKGSIQLGLAPETIGISATLDISPVNQVAAAVVALCTSPDAYGKVWDLMNPHLIHWTELWSCLQNLGYSLKIVEYQEWAKAIQNVDESNALFSLTSHYPIEIESDSYQYETKQTTKMLEKLQVPFEECDRQMLTQMFQFLKYTGFLPRI